MDQNGDRFLIDSHKIQYHPDRLAGWNAVEDDWEKAKSVYPIYLEISPAGACNHRCTFCAVDYIGYKSRNLDSDVLSRRLKEMGGLGIRSVMFAGEGEPLLHPDIAGLTRSAKKAGIDVSFTTNAVLLTEELSKRLLPDTLWIKASINAGTPEAYAAIHQTKASGFETAFANLEKAANLRAKQGLSTALGSQMVLLPENAETASDFVRRSKEAGLDYAVIKPYSQHLSSGNTKHSGTDYDALGEKVGDLSSFNDGNFQVVYRGATMQKLKERSAPYSKCHSTPFFWAYVMADGAVYSCSAYLEDDRFLLGNLLEESFQGIWQGERRKQNFRYVLEELDIAECRKNCRMDAVNRHLWAIKNPPEHVNFI